MIFPRVILQQSRFLGIAIANPTNADAEIRLTAYNLDGTLFSGGGVTNPVVAKIARGSQYARLAGQIFNPPASIIEGVNPTRLWVEVSSTATGLTGFFLEGDDQFQFMDGAQLAGDGTDLVVPLVENTGSSITELSLVNPNKNDAKIVIDFFRADGTTASTQNVTVAKGGALQGPLSSLFNISYNAIVGLRLRSDRAVVCYASVLRQTDPSLITIPAQDATTPAKTLYFPQLAEGDAWSTGIGLVNLNFTQKTLVTITAFQSDGSLFKPPVVKENPITKEIQAGGIFRSPLKELFGFPASPLQTGWIKVEASSSSIGGYVEYGAGTNRAVVTAQLTSLQSSVFSHQAMAPPYFTGLAVLNPGSLTANIEVFSLTDKGETTGKTQRVLRPGQKESLLIQQWVPAAAGKAGGSVFLQSDRPLIATQLFGTDSLSALANVPPQSVTTGFLPASSIPKIATAPPLAVVETAKTQQFTASGQSNLVWSVNGIAGGDDKTGTISSSGLYKAPGKAPAQRSLTIQASTASGDVSGGSSVDVVQRETLTGGLTLLTSVAYLENLQRFFIAEQQLLSSAPAVTSALNASNARISEVTPAGSPSQFVSISGDTIAKMIPFVDGGNSYLLLAGVDSGKIYRLNVASKQVATVVAGLKAPNSLALEPSTGNLLVSESGANQIAVVPRAQIIAASAAPEPYTAGGAGRGRINAVVVQAPQGLAVDSCKGAVYVTQGDGTLHEILGSRDRVVARNLDKPRQIQVIYREGSECADGVTLAVAEASGVSLITPVSGSKTSLITGTKNALDLTFFPRGNPFTPGGEASLGIAEGPPGSAASLISQVAVGGIYSGTPPEVLRPADPRGMTLPYEDPIGDTFATAESSGLAVPDIVSVNSSGIGGSTTITIKLANPAAENPANAADELLGFIFMELKPGGQLDPRLGAIDLFGSLFGFSVQALIDFQSAILFDLTNLKQVPIGVNYAGDTISLSIPSEAGDLSQARFVVMVGNQNEATDIAPNGGSFSLRR